MSDPVPVKPLDTPLPPPPIPGAGMIERLTSVFGNIARPYVMIVVGSGEAWAIWNGADSGIITAGGVVLLGLFTAKTVEVFNQATQNTKVAIAQANATPTP